MNKQYLCILVIEIAANYITKLIQSQNSSMAILFKITHSVQTKWSSMFWCFTCTVTYFFQSTITLFKQKASPHRYILTFMNSESEDI